MKKKAVPIILHHDLSDSVQTNRLPKTEKLWKRFGFGILNFFTSIGYGVGYALVTLFKSPAEVYKQSKSPRMERSFTRSLAGFALLLLIAAVPFFAFSLLSEGWRLGGQVLGVSDGALKDLNGAQEAIANQDYALAQTNFQSALGKLQSLQTELDQSSAVIQATSKLAPASLNTENLLGAATALTEAGLAASQMLQQLNSLSFTAEGITPQGEQTSADAIQQLNEKSKVVNAKLGEAHRLLGPLNADLLPAEYQAPVKEVQKLVGELSAQTSQLQDLSQLMADIMLGSKSFLVVLQNNNELRPTGGFIGTIAQGKIESGAVSKLDIRTVYDLDGQLNEWIKPPSPLQAVNSRLFLRDSNWFASFPESAERISVMYEKSGGETPDLIMALTPDLFVEFLKLTGPITLPTYGVTISADNFIEQVQTSTSVAYSKELNQPKQLLADLYPAMMQRLGELTKGQPITLLTMLQQGLSNKDILLYSRYPDLQDRFAKYRWTGELSKFNGDYLHINSTNLNGSKTDRAIERRAELTTTIEISGKISNELTYKVKNTMPDLPGLSNKSWVRFFVPDGSKLLGSSGFTKVELPKLPEEASYTTAPAIDRWEEGLKYDESKQMYVGREAGKTFFANWIEVAGGGEQTVSITYELKDTLPWRAAPYQLLWEKQPGVSNFTMNHSIRFPSRQVRWSSNAFGGAMENHDGINIEKQLTADHFEGLVLIPE